MKKRVLIGIIGVLFAWAGGWAEPTIKIYFSPQGGCQEAIIREIDQAKKTIDVAMYYFTSKPLAEALIRAERRGVRVRVYLDESQKTAKCSKVKELETGGCEIKFEDGPGLMHNKFCIIDKRVVITGSYNWTSAAERKNDETVLIIFEEDVARTFVEKFKEYWNN